MSERLITRCDAVKIVNQRFGIPITKSTIEKAAMNGTGPKPTAQYGKMLLYREEDVFSWALGLTTSLSKDDADPWVSALAIIPSGLIHLTADGKEQVSFEDVVTNILQIPAAQRTAVMGKRVAQAMEINGWQRPASPIKINGRNARGYWRYAATSRDALDLDKSPSIDERSLIYLIDSQRRDIAELRTEIKTALKKNA